VLQHAVDDESPILLNSRSARMDRRADRRGIRRHLVITEMEPAWNAASRHPDVTVTLNRRVRYGRCRMSKLPASRRFTRIS
jgi:hypothetical protein